MTTYWVTLMCQVKAKHAVAAADAAWKLSHAATRNFVLLRVSETAPVDEGDTVFVEVSQCYRRGKQVKPSQPVNRWPLP